MVVQDMPIHSQLMIHCLYCGCICSDHEVLRADKGR